MSIGDFVLINAYLLQLYVPLGNLGSLYRSMRQALTDVETVFTLLDRRPELQDNPNAIALKASEGNIEFRDVTFGYDARRQIIKGISFTVPAGQTVAIVGPTGSGKTTISRLLFHFYDPNEGTITLNGQNLRDVTQESLRRVEDAKT